MGQHNPNEINQLIGEFMDLQEQWERDAAAFDWSLLGALAQRGARAYNEGFGPSFHALALDCMQHGEFHERFLAFLLQAGFDPFKLARPGSGNQEIPVIDHAGLAEAAAANPSSARMRATVMEIARTRFQSLAQEMQTGNQPAIPRQYRVIEACAESIPRDLLEQIAPELAKVHHVETRNSSIDPIEGYLSTAEMIVESGSKIKG